MDHVISKFWKIMMISRTRAQQLLRLATLWPQ